MKQKAFVLQNKGMNRDLSVSKVGESSAYENHNIRILARDHDTMLSVTNERGNKKILLNDVLNSNIRVTEDPEPRITQDESFRTIDEIVSREADFSDTLIGWNVLNNHIILFLHRDLEQ